MPGIYAKCQGYKLNTRDISYIPGIYAKYQGYMLNARDII